MKHEHLVLHVEAYGAVRTNERTNNLLYAKGEKISQIEKCVQHCREYVILVCNNLDVPIPNHIYMDFNEHI